MASENHDALCAEASIVFKNGHYREAIVVFTNILSTNPHPTADIYYNRSACYTRLGQYHEAISDAKAAIGVNHHSVKAYQRLAEAQIASGNYEEARKECYHGLGIERDNQILIKLASNCDKLIAGQPVEEELPWLVSVEEHQHSHSHESHGDHHVHKPGHDHDHNCDHDHGESHSHNGSDHHHSHHHH